MSDPAVPTSAGFANRMRILDSTVAMPTVFVVVFYLRALLDLPASDWVTFASVVAAYALPVTFAIEWARGRSLRPVVVWLRRLEQGERPDREASREAFRTAIATPWVSVLRMLSIWCSAPPLISLGLFVAGSDFATGRRLFVVVAAGVLGAMISASFVFFGAKRALSDVRSRLATEIDDPVERGELVRPISVPRKVQVVVVGIVVGTSLLLVTLVQSQAQRALEAETVRWQERVLERLDERLVGGGVGFDAAVREIVPEPDLLPFPNDLAIVEGDRLRAEGGPLTERAADEIELAVAAGVSAGALTGSNIDGTLAWRAVGRNRILVSAVPEHGRGGGVAGLYLMVGLSVLLCGAVGLALAYLLGDDFHKATDALGAAAERMAMGDLSRGQVWEAEDEMGSLGRAFERMAGSLRTTVGRVAEAADRVDAAAAEIASVSQSVAVASADQVRRIQQANELMVQIKDQVSGVSGSAQALNVSVEESSSSILELGAAGDELNDTASVLSSKVEEVSGSIEQMVRSVKQVGTTTEGLSEAAGDTSSSMEEMASAMRAVDNTAETTANLSHDVVRLAESGQAKVSETIKGMEAIRDATDAAENVIRGLGARAKEIGGILDVIDDVADETNLLALNAAIIAAQAGEHGRAFSVVADEIKELADRVLASTKEIGGLIRSVQDESENAVGAIEAGSESVASGVERSAEAGTALEEITRASRESGTRIGQIVSAVREQTKATAHVVTLMEGVRTGVQQISTAGAEQDRGNEVVYRSAVTMREVAQQVRRTTEEQSRGFGRIRESVEGVREAVEDINTSLQEQTTACSQVASFLEQVFEGTRSNEEAAQRMGSSMRDLLTQAQALRDDVARFRI